MIFILLFVESCLTSIQYMIFQYGSEPVLIQWIFIGLEAILEIAFLFIVEHIVAYFLENYFLNNFLKIRSGQFSIRSIQILSVIFLPFVMIARDQKG